MRSYDEMRNAQIKNKLAKHGVAISLTTVRRSRKPQGGTSRFVGTASLSEMPTKSSGYAQQVLESGDTFHNVIFSDKCSISLVHYRCTCYRKFDEPSKWKPKPKHPLKVHVWAGISRHGATDICIFDGIMDANLFCNVLETTLVPFIREGLHQFMEDNDPAECRET